MNERTRKIVFNGIMIALVCMVTMVIQIPMPGTSGYINVGDSIIFISSILFGPITGMLAGGIGSMLADILSGYAHWAIFSLLIKGLEGYLVGILIKNNIKILRCILSTTIGVLTMVTGYFISGIILKGSVLISLGSVPANLIQGIVSMIIAILISSYLRKVKYVNKFKSNL